MQGLIDLEDVVSGRPFRIEMDLRCKENHLVFCHRSLDCCPGFLTGNVERQRQTWKNNEAAQRDLTDLCQPSQPGEPAPSVRRQCALLGISRGQYYYIPQRESAENLVLMRRLDELHLQHPVYGSRRLTAHLHRHGCSVNRKRVRRLMELMGLEAIYPKPNTSQPGEGHEIYPYLLKGKEISGPNQVWCADITYIPMKLGFLYLVAIMDWWSRFVLAWQISNTLDTRFCIQAWQAALKAGTRAPLIANTDRSHIKPPAGSLARVLGPLRDGCSRHCLR